MKLTSIVLWLGIIEAMFRKRYPQSPLIKSGAIIQQLKRLQRANIFF